MVGLQDAQGDVGSLPEVAPLVDHLVGDQPVELCRAAHELPQAHCAGRRGGPAVVIGLDRRQEHQLRRHAALLKLLQNVIGVERGPLQDAQHPGPQRRAAVAVGPVCDAGLVGRNGQGRGDDLQEVLGRCRQRSCRQQRRHRHGAPPQRRASHGVAAPAARHRGIKHGWTACTAHSHSFSPKNIPAHSQRPSISGSALKSMRRK